MFRPTARILTCLMIALSVAVLTTATAEDAQPVELFRTVLSDDPVAGQVSVEIDALAFAEIRRAGRSVVDAVPLPDGRLLRLELSPFQVLAPGAKLVRVGVEGTRTVTATDLRFLRGHVIGEPDSQAVLTLFQGRVLGEVRIGDEAFGIGPERLELSATDASRMRIWNRNIEDGGWTCGVQDSDSAGLTRAIDSVRLIPEGPMEPAGILGPRLALQLALESTTEWCENFGNDAAAAEAYLMSAVAQISTIYDAEIQVLVQVPFLRTFCGVADPYTDDLTLLADRSQLLDEFRMEWRTNMTSVERTVAHLYSRSTQTNTAGGLGYTHTCSGQNCSSVLCDTDFGYAVNLLPATGANAAGFEVRVAAHELGHNHSSPHTSCLQDNAGQWISTCNIESCGSNPNCQVNGCYPGPENDSVTGTLMSTGCDSSVATIEDEAVELILRGANEAASCVEAAGLPGSVREQTGDGLRLSKVPECPTEELRNDDGGTNQLWGACSNCQYAWIKRYTPGCYPYQLERVDAVIPNVSVGRPMRVLVYVDPEGTGDPANSTLVYSEDVTVQVSNNSAFNEYTLASSVIVGAGDVYIGLYDLQQDAPAPFLAALDSSDSGDSYWAINAIEPTDYNPRPDGTWMIRGQGGPVPAGSVVLTWGLACNDASTPGQDFGVYRGDMPDFTQYSSLTCSTNGQSSYFADAPASGSFFLVVPQTTPAEGGYGLDSSGAERSPAPASCKPQDLEPCPGP